MAAIDMPARRDSTLSARLLAVRRRLRSLPVFPVSVLTIIVFCGLFADFLAPHDPLLGQLQDQYTPPAWEEGGSTKFLLGTDHLGRDMLSRILFGARISLIITFVAIALAGSLGTFIGLIAGHFSGWIDEVLMRIVDMQLSLPSLLIALVMLVVFGSSFWLLVLIIGLWLWPSYARMVRGEILRVRTFDYVSLARIAGCSTWRILFTHELPAVQSTLIVTATLQAGWVILLEGSLSFLGVGVPPPTPSWGSMISEGRGVIATEWWISLLPGVAMLLTVLSLNLLGDWLRDVLDPNRVVVN